MKILVTGGAGFIGSHVAEAFMREGHRVIVVDDLSSGRADNLPQGVRLEVMDIRSEQVADLIAREQPEVLCHHAAQMDVRRSVADPQFDASVNILGLLNLLEAGRRNGLKRVLFASTGGAIYGEQQVFPCPETHPTNPVSPYGVAKLASEKYLHFYAEAYGIRWTALRYANVYGPRQNPHGEAGVVAIFTEKLLRGEQPVINGDGKQTRDYVYVGDLVRANILALQSDYCGPLNLGTGRETDVNTLFHLLCRACGVERPEVHGPAKPGEQRRSSIDSTLAAQVLGWRPEVALEDGLRRTVEYFRSRLQHPGA
ncbi:MAG: GDP-mannose 4,6-dehydratase [Candidatus Binatia bacterium]|nr:GDP-mannose 4,6-dehydratase [Candidatus Binatia bacterium]